MFSIQVTDSDKFLEMPLSTQALYFHLGMHGDDDGFVSSPKKIARSVGCNDDDLRLLAAKDYIIPFENGVVVIRDWNINNHIRKDRYRATIHMGEKDLLSLDVSGKYLYGNQLATTCQPTSNQLTPEYSIGEDSRDKERRDVAAEPPKRFIPPSIEQVQAYCLERNNGIDPAAFVDFYATRGWMVGRNRMKDWRAAVRTWEHRSKNNAPDAPEQRAKRYEIIDGEAVVIDDE